MSSPLFVAFEKVAHQFANKIAVIEHATKQQWTYSELLEAVLLKSSYYVEPFSAGQKVGLCLWNTPDFVMTFLAFQALGLVPVLISPRLTETERQHIIEDASLSGLVLEDSLDVFVPRLEQALDDLLPLETAVMFYTSGTTGTPKGVMLSHQNVLANIRINQDCLEITPKDVLMSTSPFTHVFGLINVMLNSLFSGTTLILTPSFQPRVSLDIITEYQVTVLLAVPTMYQLLVACLPSLQWDLDSIRVCHSGAAPMPKALIEQIECLFEAPVQEGYGLSEVTSIATSNPLHGPRKQGSIGKALPGVSIEIVNDSGELVGPNTQGELKITGETVMLGYYGQADKTKARLVDGWVMTGDIGYQDEDGYFFLEGRQDDLMNIGGFKVYPKEIEEVLYHHPAVASCAVVPVPNDVFYHEAHAFLVLHAGYENDSELIPQLQKHCAETLAQYKIPRVFHVIDSIPQTPSGKILRRELLALLS